MARSVLCMACLESSYKNATTSHSPPVDFSADEFVPLVGGLHQRLILLIADFSKGLIVLGLFVDNKVLVVGVFGKSSDTFRS